MFPSIAIIQEAAASQLATRLPAVLEMARVMFASFMVILLIQQGIRGLWGGGVRDHEWVEFILFLAFGSTMLLFYDTPLFGTSSVSSLVPDTAAYMANLFEQQALSNIERHLDTIRSHFIAPGALEVVANGIYLGLLAAIGMAKVLTLSITAGSFIATAICILVGPFFVAFFVMRPWLDWLFWGWFKILFASAFVQVINQAYLMIFEHYVFTYATNLPMGITSDLYVSWGVNAASLIASLGIGILAVPLLAYGLFSGHGVSGGNIVSSIMGR